MKGLICASILSIGLLGFITSSSALAMNAHGLVVHTDATGTRVRLEVEVGLQPALDILFVIDDSGSMAVHQANFFANVKELVRASTASGVDLHAGVITTSAISVPPPAALGQGVLVGSAKKYASTSEGDFDAVLDANLRAAMTTYGNPTEQPFEAMRLALSEPAVSGPNHGFIREGAGLAIFVVTDADDQSPDLVDTYIQMLKALKPTAPVSLHAAYIPVAETTCDTSGELRAVRLEEALSKFGTLSESVSLCDPSYGTKLQKIGEGYGVVTLRMVQLKKAPDLSTMHITFGNQNLEAGDLEYGWIYDASKMQILFGSKIDWKSEPAGTRVLIDYLAK
jgi:hypothetical protein